jgi:hypothetical protein
MSNWRAVCIERCKHGSEGGRRKRTGPSARHLAGSLPYDNLGFDDLLAAAKLLDQAHTWITHQLEADRKGRKQSEKAA